MKLSYLLEKAGIEFETPEKDMEITEIETNSGNVTAENAEGVLFVCIKGTHYDTHKDMERLVALGVRVMVAEHSPDGSALAGSTSLIIVPDARKALALLSQAFFGFPDKEMTLVGITGTKGKTTVSYMLAEICRKCGCECGIIGTNGISFCGRLYDSENTTPGSCRFFRALREMADTGVKYVFCEVTSQALKQSRAYGVSFDLAVFTNMFPDHIGKDEHESYYEYRECKALLFAQCKRAVLNGEDGEFAFFRGKCESADIPYSVFLPSEADDNISAALRIPGTFNYANAVCAAAAAEILGFAKDGIEQGISNVKVPGRCETVENPAGLRIVIDYAHNKESLENILKALKSDCSGRLYCVFGAGGDRSRLRRSGMGEAAAKYADFSVVTNDNPRSEPPLEIIKDILQGMKDAGERYTVIPDRASAIHYALSKAEAGDTVLLAGKGAQTYEEINGVKHPLDEREIVAGYYKDKFTRQ